jgi:hypothetical protein
MCNLRVPNNPFNIGMILQQFGKSFILIKDIFDKPTDIFWS